jgi:hypothetical protein
LIGYFQYAVAGGIDYKNIVTSIDSDALRKQEISVA